LFNITPFSVHNKVNTYITNKTARQASNAFFGVGEFVVDKSIQFVNKSTEQQTPSKKLPKE
jgi:hypothetical protein